MCRGIELGSRKFGPLSLVWWGLGELGFREVASTEAVGKKGRFGSAYGFLVGVRECQDVLLAVYFGQERASRNHMDCCAFGT